MSMSAERSVHAVECEAIVKLNDDPPPQCSAHGCSWTWISIDTDVLSVDVNMVNVTLYSAVYLLTLIFSFVL